MENFKSILKKYWIIGLAFLIIFASVLYFIKVAYEEGWIAPIIIIITGIVVGLSGFVAGFALYKKNFKIMAEIFAGFGCGVTYATIAYSGFSFIWNNYTVFLSLLSLTAFVTWVNYKFNLRVLTSIGFAAGLFTPFIVRASEFNILLLFVYVAVINVALIIFTVLKKWREVPVIGIVLTFLLYISYYLYIKPSTWLEPFAYVFIIYLIFSAGLLLLTKTDGKNFEGLNLYLSIINAIWFVFWSIYIFQAFSLNTSIPILIVGAVFIISAAVIYLSFPKSIVASLIFFFGGLFLVAVSGGNLGDMVVLKGMNHIIRAAIWLFVATTIFLTGYKIKNNPFMYTGAVGWIIIFIYWYIFAWDTSLVKWFGVDFIPFINPPGLLWLFLAATGFLVSVFCDRMDDYYRESNKNDDSFKTDAVNVAPQVEEFRKGKFKVISLVIAILSHLTIGGLLTIQIKAFWEIYNITFIDAGIAFSICWGIYAFILFVWGTYTKKRLFIYFSDVVIVIVAAKVLFFDIAGQANFYKVITTLITGLIVLLIGFLNYFWQNKSVEKLKEGNAEE